MTVRPKRWAPWILVVLFLLQVEVSAGNAKRARTWTEQECAKVLTRYSRHRRSILDSRFPDLFSPRHSQFVLLVPEVLEAAARWEGLREHLEPGALGEGVWQLPENRNVLSIWIGLDAPESTANPGQIVLRIEPSKCLIRDPTDRERFLRPVEPVGIPTFVMKALLGWSKLDRATIVSFPRDAQFWNRLAGGEFELEYRYDSRDRIYGVKFKRELIESP